MATNPLVNIPKVQTQDRNVNQLQQNIITGINQLSRAISSNISSAVDASTIVGEVKSAFLTETQIQAQLGAGWILCDGRAVPGSQYETLTGSSSIPDMRGVVPRGKDNGAGLNPDGDLALGTYQADAFNAHTHGPGNVYNDGQLVGAGATTRNMLSLTPAAANQNMIIGTAGGNETRGKSTTINFFIRIN